MSRSIERSTASRRTFLQRVALSGLAAGPGSALLAACAGGGDDDEEPDTAEPTDGGATEDPAAADNPFGLNPEGELEIFIFDGGFGDAYATDIHEPMLQAKWPNLTINHNKDADITAALQSRFVAGDPPDFINNSGNGQMDFATLVANGQLADLTPLFDAPSWDDPSVPVRDTLVPGTIEQGTFDKPYVLNYAFTVFGFWYNKTLFDSNGWTPPRTWAEMLDLCEEIKGTGIAPWTYPGGIAPRYMHWPLLSMAATLAGPEILVDVDNLVEGAWKHDAILEAANALRGLRENDYFLEGSEGLTHIQSQVQWALGNVAFVSCGTWLENEVAKSFEDPALQEEHELNPDDELAGDFEFAMATYPLLSDDAAMPYETVFARAGEPYIIPSQASHPEAAMEYMRAMLSMEGARGFTEMVTSLTAVLGSSEGVDLGAPGLTSAQEALNAAGTNVLNYKWDSWYPTMNNPGIDAHTGDLLAGRKTVEEWADGCEEEAGIIRDDDSLQKYTR